MTDLKSHFLIKELFRSVDDKVYTYWVTTAKNEEEALRHWQNNFETNWNEFETSSGNLRIFEYAKLISEEEFITLKRYFPEIWEGE